MHDNIIKYCDDRIGCDKRVLLGAQLPHVLAFRRVGGAFD